LTSRQVTAQLLCVSDDAGAQTCITKAQLDAVLASLARSAAIEPPATVTEAKAPALAEPAAMDEPSTTITEAKAPALAEPAAMDEPSTTITEAMAPALVEPAMGDEQAVTVTEPKASALVEPAIVDEPAVTITEPKNSALAEPAEETTGVASIGVASLSPAPIAHLAPWDQEPEHTGSLSLPSSGAALVSHPEVEVSIPAPVRSSE
jgi:hypothetical protein